MAPFITSLVGVAALLAAADAYNFTTDLVEPANAVAAKTVACTNFGDSGLGFGGCDADTVTAVTGVTTAVGGTAALQDCYTKLVASNSVWLPV